MFIIFWKLILQGQHQRYEGNPSIFKKYLPWQYCMNQDYVFQYHHLSWSVDQNSLAGFSKHLSYFHNSLFLPAYPKRGWEGPSFKSCIWLLYIRQWLAFPTSQGIPNLSTNFQRQKSTLSNGIHFSNHNTAQTVSIQEWRWSNWVISAQTRKQQHNSLNPCEAGGWSGTRSTQRLSHSLPHSHPRSKHVRQLWVLFSISDFSNAFAKTEASHL